MSVSMLSFWMTHALPSTTSGKARCTFFFSRVVLAGVVSTFTGAGFFGIASIVVGKNFGCGSSRQQAVDCFKALGISVIIAESFGAIYERNAINSGMPILIAEGISKKLYDKDVLSLDFTTGQITDKTQKKSFNAKPFSETQKEIYLRGGLLGG